MRVAVLGAAGTIAPAIVRDLAASEEVDELLLLDLDGRRARAVAAEHGAGKAWGAHADAGDPGSLAHSIHGAGALVNSASYRVNLDAMRACLAARCHYLDLGGLYWMTSRQLGLGREFARAGLVAVLGIGSAPGKTNLMGAIAARELGMGDAANGAGVRSMHVSAAGRDLAPPEGESFPYALRTLIDEVSLPPVAVANGEPAELEPLAAGGEVDFGDPIGVVPTIHTLHSEMLTFPASFGCREASFRLSLAEPVERRLRELADADGEEVARVAAAASPPSPRTVSVHLVEARRGTLKVRVRSVTPPHEGWRLGGGIVSTATPIAAAVRLLARGHIPARGALPPERCLDTDEVLAELEQRGVRFETEVLEEEAVQ